MSYMSICHKPVYGLEDITCGPEDGPQPGGPMGCFSTDSIKWAPSALVWALVPFSLFYLISRGKESSQLGIISTARMGITVFLSTLTMVYLSKERQTEDRDAEQFNMNSSQIVILVLLALVLKLERSPGCSSSVPLILFWLFILATSCFSVYTSVLQVQSTETCSLFLPLVYLFGAVVQLILSWTTVTKTRLPQKVPEPVEQLHPEDQASFRSKFFLDWVTKIVWTGYKKRLEESDVPDVNSRDKCETVCPTFEKAWKEELRRCQEYNKKIRLQMENAHICNGTSHENRETNVSTSNEGKFANMEKKPSLFRALLRAYGAEYFLWQGAKCIVELCDFFDPLIIRAMMKHVENKDTEPAWKGYALVVTMFLLSVIKGSLHQRLWVCIRRLNKHIKIAVEVAVYKKALTATNESKKLKTSGELLSLISEDLDKFIVASDTVFFIILTPIQILLAVYMLYEQLGAGAFVGLAILVTLIPCNRWVGKKVRHLEEKREEVKDERVKAMNEILNGIKVLKLYAWEESFMAKVLKIRDREMDIFKKIGYCWGGIDMLFRAVPFLVQLAGFVVFVLLGGHLDPATALLSITLFNLLNDPFAELSLIIPECVQASVSIDRINNFLIYKDIPNDIVTMDGDADAAVSIKDGTFTWDEARKPTLTNINLQIPRGGLVAVVGMVGAGKSSLLSAMLGEMEKVKGNVTMQSCTAYVSQEAWIQNATLKGNILFGSELEPKRYEEVVSACALREDLKILAAADQTEIGEKGINLSGGQKQRVSLARAVYSDADIYLLDDPLSAVDAHVGKHIFHKVIGHSGMLKDKTRVLVTHGVHWLPFVDNIIVMKDGQISERGTFKQLLSHNGAFAQFVKEVFAHNELENDSEVEKIKRNIFSRLTSLNEDEAHEHKSTVNDASNSQDQENSSDTSFSEDELADDDDDEDDDENRSIDGTDGVVNKNDKSPGQLDETKGKIIDDEDMKYGNVSREVYKGYINAIGPRFVLILIVMFASLLISRDLKKIWIGRWTEDPLLANISLKGTPEYRSSLLWYIAVYGLCGTMEVVLAFLVLVVVLKRSMKAANYFHNKLLLNILRSPMSFFDTTPSGRVINRFSKDVGCVDNLGDCLDGYIRIVGNIIIHLVMAISITPMLICFIIPVIIAFTVLQQIFMPSGRQLRRYRSKYKSPIFVHFKETLDGVMTIRAFKSQDRFVKNYGKVIEDHMKFDIMEMFVRKWFGIKAALFSSVISLAAGLLVLSTDEISPYMSGLVLIYSSSFVHYMRRFNFHATVTEQQLVSLERVVEYSKKPTEAAWEIAESVPPQHWPENGEILLNDYKARYRDGLDLVLKGITCSIRGGEKIGIVGRTGAGKTSLTIGLFRLVEAAGGHITVDSHKIASLGLHDLRKRLTILPQDPVIFGGSLRMNLDPFNEKSTEELWEVLKHSHLKSFVESLPEKLDYDCGEGGKNLSVGQRQLVCLARTLLRKTKVLVLDEATAAVDMETDDLIQKTICNEFKECTVLTIAHRLNTIMDYDRILVLDQGLVKEFDTPTNLLANQNSAFYSMAKDAKLI